MGSIGGGGRYDNLTCIFGLQNVGGVGISFGLDRIYLVLEALDLFPKAILAGPQVFFVNFGDSESLKAMTIVHKLRKLGISCYLYPSANKVQKQIETYDTARSKNIQITKSDDDSFNSDSFRASPKELK